MPVKIAAAPGEASAAGEGAIDRILSARAPAAQWQRLIRPMSLRWGKRAWQFQMMRAILSCGGDVGLLAAIASTSALMTDAVPWSGLWEGRGQGFGGDPHGR